MYFLKSLLLFVCLVSTQVRAQNFDHPAIPIISYEEQYTTPSANVGPFFVKVIRYGGEDDRSKDCESSEHLGQLRLEV